MKEGAQLTSNSPGKYWFLWIGMLASVFFLNITHTEMYYPVSKPSIQLTHGSQPIIAHSEESDASVEEDPIGEPIVSILPAPRSPKSNGVPPWRMKTPGIQLTFRLERPPQSAQI